MGLVWPGERLPAVSLPALGTCAAPTWVATLAWTPVPADTGGAVGACTLLAHSSLGLPGPRRGWLRPRRRALWDPLGFESFPSPPSPVSRLSTRILSLCPQWDPEETIGGRRRTPTEAACAGQKRTWGTEVTWYGLGLLLGGRGETLHGPRRAHWASVTSS